MADLPHEWKGLEIMDILKKAQSTKEGWNRVAIISEALQRTAPIGEVLCVSSLQYNRINGEKSCQVFESK